jgi:hypothetical protein
VKTCLIQFNGPGQVNVIIADIMTVVKSGRHHTLSPDLERVCAEISALGDWWARNVRFALLSYEEALHSEVASQPVVARRVSLAQNTAFGAQTYICEDGPVLPKEHGPHAEEGMYTQGGTLSD